MSFDRERRRYVKAAGIGLAAALAGCSSGGKQPNNAGSTQTTSGQSGGSSTSKSASSGSPTKVVYWSQVITPKVVKPWNKWYKQQAKKQANLNVELDGFEYSNLRKKYLTGGRTGTPDMVEGVLSQLGEYQSAGLMQPLDSYVKNKKNFDAYYQNTLDALTFKNKLYALPVDANGRGLLYRKDILDKYGFDVPQTANDLHDIAQTITKNEDNMTGFQNCTKDGGPRTFQEWISHVYQQADALYAHKNGSWTLVPSADKLGQIFDNWYAKIWAGKKPIADTSKLGTGWQVLDPGYAKGHFAMCPNGPWVRSANQHSSKKAPEILNKHTGVTDIPRGKGGKKSSYLEVEWTGINAHSKKKDAAWKATDIYTSTPSYKQFAKADPGNWLTPVSKDVNSTIQNDSWKPFKGIFQRATGMAFVNWGSTKRAVFKSIQRVAYGKSDPYKEGKSLHTKLKSIASGFNS